jgi:hypothetical protein
MIKTYIDSGWFLLSINIITNFIKKHTLYDQDFLVRLVRATYAYYGNLVTNYINSNKVHSAHEKKEILDAYYEIIYKL